MIEHNVLHKFSRQLLVLELLFAISEPFEYFGPLGWDVLGIKLLSLGIK